MTAADNDSPLLSRRRTMNRRTFAAALLGLSIAMPLVALGAPDEAQRMLMQQTQEAKQKLASAQAAKGADRQKLMQEHMKLMQQLGTQMQAAKPREGMSAQELREWVDEHIKLMNQMMAQMMEEHHMMMMATPAK
jgi:hypothetical protein